MAPGRALWEDGGTVWSCAPGLLALGVLAAAAAASAASFEGVGRAAGAESSRVRGVSADGSVAVGSSYNAPGFADEAAFRWEAGVRTELPALTQGGCTPERSRAEAASGDGSRVVGLATCDGEFVHVRWDGGGAPVIVPGAGTTFSPNVTDVSDDGSLMVGTGHYLFPPILYLGYEMSGGGASVLGDDSVCNSPPGLGSEAVAVSGDGNVVVGNQYCLFGTFMAPFWGRYVGGALEVTSGLLGRDASFDGSVIVGFTIGSNQAASWRPGTGTTPLGQLPGGSTSSSALGVSADGSVIVGSASTAGGSVAFVWDAAHGMRALADVLAAAGAPATGWSLGLATAVSADGLTVVGQGTNPQGDWEGFVARLVPTPTIPALPTGGAPLLGALLVLAALATRTRRHGPIRSRR